MFAWIDHLAKASGKTNWMQSFYCYL